MSDGKRHDGIPSDQFERVVDEMRRFSVLLDEQERHVRTARGISGLEARRCFSLSSVRLQEAGFWFQQALQHAHIQLIDGESELGRDKSPNS